MTEQQCAKPTHQVQHFNFAPESIDVVEMIASRALVAHVKPDRSQQFLQMRLVLPATVGNFTPERRAYRFIGVRFRRRHIHDIVAAIAVRRGSGS
jgi:hypothetical protein